MAKEKYVLERQLALVQHALLSVSKENRGSQISNDVSMERWRAAAAPASGLPFSWRQIRQSAQIKIFFNLYPS
jgi:hypothetical protein